MRGHKQGLEICECLLLADMESAYKVMSQLRTNITVTEYLERVKLATSAGYRLFCARDKDTIVGVIGFRVQHDLCWGTNLYVDDLVVDEYHRRQGIGTALMQHAENSAKEINCDFVRLASGINKQEAHRFYEAIGYKKTSYAFALKL